MPHVSDERFAHVELYGPEDNLVIGEDVHIGEGSLINCNDRVVIEDHVMFGHRVMVLAGGHDTSKKGAERIHSAPPQSVAVTIRKGAWIGSGAILVGPCEIGENAVVGAGAVVKGVVLPNVRVVGNPARVC